MWRILSFNRAMQVWLPLAVIVCWVLPNSLQASIILPEEVPFDLEQLIAQRDVAAASSSSSQTSPRRSAPVFGSKAPWGMPPRPGELLYALSLESILPAAGGGSSSGASTSSGGTSGTTTSPIDTTAAVPLAATDLVRWISSEQHLALPMPPGNDLLRPPQIG
jgi:hypothetical protein